MREIIQNKEICHNNQLKKCVRQVESLKIFHPSFSVYDLLKPSPSCTSTSSGQRNGAAIHMTFSCCLAVRLAAIWNPLSQPTDVRDR